MVIYTKVDIKVFLTLRFQYKQLPITYALNFYSGELRCIAIPT
jgi:hypothetical protein